MVTFRIGTGQYFGSNHFEPPHITSTDMPKAVAGNQQTQPKDAAYDDHRRKKIDFHIEKITKNQSGPSSQDDIQSPHLKPMRPSDPNHIASRPRLLGCRFS